MRNDLKKDRPILPFTLKDGFELARTAPPNIPSLVDGLLIQVGTSLLSADPKCGKSSIARQLMVSVAEGRDFLGYPTMEGDALYLYLEGPEGVVQQHFQKLGLSDQRGKVKVIEERMPEDQVFGLQCLSLTIKSLPNLRLIVVDPLSKLLRLKDSGSTDEVTPAMAQLEQFAKEHNLHVMALMHERKRKSEDRHQNSLGSVAFRGSADTNISITKQGKQRIISTEQRWGRELEPTLIEWNQENLTSELGKTLESQEQEKRQTKGKKTVERIKGEILLALEKESLTQNEVLTRVSGKSVKILDVLAELVATAKVQTKVEGRAIRHSLTAAPAIPLEVAA
jgi:AAA domain